MALYGVGDKEKEWICKRKPLVRISDETGGKGWRVDSANVRRPEVIIVDESDITEGCKRKTKQMKS